MNQNLIEKTILVTGATGFLGSYIIRYLLLNGYKKIVALKRKTSQLVLVEDFKDSISWIECDLQDIEVLDEVFKKVNFVIHAAGLVAFSRSDRRALHMANVEGTANLVNLALANHIDKFIYISSVAAIGSPVHHQLIDEKTDWSESKLNTLYATSKQLGEREVWRGQVEGLNTLVINPSYIFGAGIWDEGPTSIVKKIYHGMKYYPKGSNGIVDVRDVAEFCVLSLENQIQGERFILSALNLSHKDLFSIIADEFGKPRPTVQLNKWMGSLAWRFEKIKSLITGKKPIVTRETLLISSIKFQYDSAKSIDLLNFDYRPIEDTIKATCQSFLGGISRNEKVGILPIEFHSKLKTS